MGFVPRPPLLHEVNAIAHRWAGLLTFESPYSPGLPTHHRQWPLQAFVVDYSGGTVRDFHPLPY
jgi:hypothetical protein